MKTFKSYLRRSQQSGQAIVVMMFLMVVLLAMLGLAIDGGGMYFLRRDMQNAVDAAVLAATYARCTNGNIYSAALEAAADNGFDNNLTSNGMMVYNPPESGPGAGDDSYVEIILVAQKPSYFIHLVYREPLVLTVRAVGHCKPAFDPTTVPALWGGSSTCQNTVSWTGSSARIDGGIFSNNEIQIGGGGQSNYIIGDSGAVNGIEDNNTTWDPAPDGSAEPREDPLQLDIEEYAPGGDIATAVSLYRSIQSSTDDTDFRNGVWDPRNGRVLEGLYYVNGNVRIGSGVVMGDRNNDGRNAGITIVATGSIDFSGGSNASYYHGGILLFSNRVTNCGTDAIHLSGSQSTWYGVIYAPYGGVSLSNSRMTLVGAILGNTVSISGSQLDLRYDPSILPPRPPEVDMSE